MAQTLSTESWRGPRCRGQFVGRFLLPMAGRGNSSGGRVAERHRVSMVRLASGRVVDYAIHFDRNSLDDSVRVGGGLIALTSSGAHLLVILRCSRSGWLSRADRRRGDMYRAR